MRVKLVIGAVLAAISGSLTLAGPAGAQGPSGPRPMKIPIIHQIDELGRNILEGLFPSGNRSPSRRTVSPPGEPQFTPPWAVSRSRSAPVGTARVEVAEPGDSDRTRRESEPVPESRRSTDVAAERSSGIEVAPDSEPAASSLPPDMTESSLAPESSAQEGSPGLMSRRLYERLAALRESAFDEFPDPQSNVHAASDAPSESPSEIRQPLGTSSVGLPARPDEDEGVAEPSAGETKTAELDQTKVGPVAGQPTLAPPTGQPTLAPPADRPTPAPARDRLENRTVETAQSIAPAETPPKPAAAAAETPPTGTVAAERGGAVLFTRQSPILDVKTIGPRRIAVGRESSYVLMVRNSGPVAADQVVITVEVPDSAEVVGGQPSAGTTDWAASTARARVLRWAVGHLEPKRQEELVLRIVPRESRPLDLAVKWDCTPVVSQAVIEVEEPKLEMRLDGPREILYGQRGTYRLELVNSGSGNAENVEIALLPLGVGNHLAAKHRVGTIAPEEKRVVEVELTARQTGTLLVNVEARGAGGLQAKLAEEILVLRPGLLVKVAAPPVQFVNSDVTYEIGVSNPGTAPATNVKVTALIPAEAKYVSSSQNGQLSSDGGHVTWALDRVAPGAEETLAITCTLAKSSPAIQFAVRSEADGDLAASAEVITSAKTIPDLVLEVSDPRGPVAVGSEAAYQVVVENRGTENAEDVEIVAYFSHGFEPTSAEGAGHRIGSGQVAFDKIASLAVGQSVALSIHAQAEKPGNHIFRVEVYCKPSGIRLVSEETTHFYDGQPVAQQARLSGATSAGQDSSQR